ncbi:putative histidine transporter YuiF (NhaC family) [Solibacillus kalamii]|uniref:Na+/H+ antiporter family protein n=2 Tax=Solibacillus TaxID=648800 RepID=K1L1V3_9BACL|nr:MULTISPECIES: Na+/H+ antiporter NhaC family protein [Solibacillus]AMO87310.1 sodium:proton antiporter [Solibacillus silvestris]EKB44643.1 Na+/H+ antiporter family protein [Solibacillus isronensis B3W22]MBM7666165.1 putative histidine transporter YuiF (NhaC family) [Solibacillus kalamii]OUZ38320.1 sodium:proton antiporter [Solibacillus kalamii]
MNAVLIAVGVMLILSLLRINVVLSLTVGAIIGGLAGGLNITETIKAFVDGLGGGATIALSYALLGGFALAISRTGIPEVLVKAILKIVQNEGDTQKKGAAKALIFLVLLAMAIMSQNLIPVHIAFIPLIVPPMIKIMNMLQIDRRLIACILTFGLVMPYMFIPAGFGLIYQGIIVDQMALAGLDVALGDVPKAMAIVALGMAVGLVGAFVAYRKPRQYENVELETTNDLNKEVNKLHIIFAAVALVTSIAVQVMTDSMIVGSIAGIIILYITGTLKVKEADAVLSDGMRMMAFVGFVMISANGFSAVINATGDVELLVSGAMDIFNGNVSIAVLIMLIVGLIVTMGIGSSFATIPIIAAIFVPIAMELGLSELAIICLIGTAGVLGDAGSPASDSTLGPTAGLNVDGQHNHIWDTCVPTFLFYNIPQIIFGWIAVVFFL